MELQEAADRLGQWAAGGLDADVLAGMDTGLAVARGYAVVFMQGHGQTGAAHERLWQTIDQVKASVVKPGESWTGALKAGSPAVKYAAIQEEGGTIQHPGSEGKLQVFQKDGNTVFTMKTKPHAITIPGLHYLSGSIEQEIDVIKSEIGVAVVAGLEAVFR
jgi:hypothetical protein